MEEHPVKRFKQLCQEYNELSREIQRDYKAKKITAIEAWNKLPAPEPMINIIPSCTAQYLGQGYRHEYDYGCGEPAAFLGNLMADICTEAWKPGVPPWDLRFNTLEQKAEWFNENLAEGRNRRQNDIYHELKRKSDEYEKKIREQDALDNAIADNRERERERRIKREIYRQEIYRQEVRNSLRYGMSDLL